MSDKIQSTSFDIQNKWLTDVAPKYFELSDMNMLRLGLFGYINEIQSNSLEDSINMMNMVSNEIYPNKAILPNSVYAYAALGDFSDFNAVPAELPFTLALRKEDLIKYSVQKSGYKQYTISRYSNLLVNDINFMLDYDIIIKLRWNSEGSDYILSARYNFDIKNSLSGITNPYIASKVMPIQNEEYLFLNLTAKQLKRQEFNFLVLTTDLVESIKFDIDYEGVISDFNVFYSPNGTDEKIQVAKYYVDSIKPEEEYFCFYKHNEENQLSILFSAHPDYFKPEFNSKLMVEIYTSTGTKGNFVYDGEEVDFSFYVNENKLNRNTDVTAKILHFAYVIGESKGGKDAMELEEIKYNAIKAFSVRKNIISENDLDYYFRDITKNCKMTFIKKRDDMIKRIYSAFILLRNLKNEIIPSNTLNVMLSSADFDTSGNSNGTNIYTIKPGKLYGNPIYIDVPIKRNTVVIPEEPDEYYTTINEGLDYVLENEDVGSYFYTIPYLIKINTNPYFVSYYLNSVFDRYSMIFSYINEDNLNDFIISAVNIRRNALNSSKYKISFDLNTSLDKNFIIVEDEHGNFIEDLGNIKARIYLKTNNTYIGYADCTLDSISTNGLFFNFSCELETSDYINNNDEISIINSLYSPTNVLEVLKEECPVPADKVFLEVAIFYNGYSNKNKGVLKGYTQNSLTDYCLCNLYQTSEEIRLFKDVNNIEYSTLILDTTDKDNILYKIKSLPMIKYSYIYDEDNMEELITLLDYFRKSLQSTLQIIENNFDIDMKFYNTYGNSKYFTIGQDRLPLTSTAIRIYLRIKLNVELTDMVKQDLESFIINYVEAVNSGDDHVNYLYVSNLIQSLENSFDYIRYIEFEHFNNESPSLQIIENSFTDFKNMTNKQIIKYVPEFINVSRISSLNVDGELIYTPEVYITYL